MNVSLKKFLFFMFRLSTAYVFISVAIFFSGSWITGRFLPAIEAVIHVYGSGHETLDLETEISSNILRITHTPKLSRHIDGVHKPLSNWFSNEISGSILFVPHIIFYSFILSWTGISWKRRLAVILLSIPVMAAFFIADASSTLIVTSSINTEAYLERIGMKSDHTFMTDLFYLFDYLFNNGGRQFMGILMIIVATVPLHIKGIIPKKNKLKRIPNRNDPCICGSGKKYKNCCMK